MMCSPCRTSSATIGNVGLVCPWAGRPKKMAVAIAQNSMFTCSDQKERNKYQAISTFSTLADLFLILDRCDQEKHRAASFIPHFGMLVPHFLRRLRFGELSNGETRVN